MEAAQQYVAQIQVSRDMQAVDPQQWWSRVREQLYAQMGRYLSDVLRDGQAWCVQYGVPEKQPDMAGWGGSWYHPGYETWVLRAIVRPVEVQRRDGVYRTFEWSGDYHMTQPVQALYSMPGDYSFDKWLDELAGKRKYVYRMVRGKMWGWERTSTGWLRLF